MTTLDAAIRTHAASRPGDIVLDDARGRTVRWGELPGLVEGRIRTLRGLGAATLGIHCDNGIEWVLADLAAHVAGLPTVPLPKFFTPAQAAHVIRTAAIDALVTDDVDGAADLGFDLAVAPGDGAVWIARRDAGAANPVAFQKVTFTSGTTGTPKGVCLARAHLETIARALMAATGSLPSDPHLCCLPLSILLENIAGVHRTLFSGGRVIVPPLAEVGLGGAQQYDPVRALRALRESAAASAILVPEMLKGLVVFSGGDAGTRLRYIGVGGARVAPSLLEAAQGCGLPAYEGYGLSEFASVVALNTPGDSRIGASGRPLPHLEFRIAENDEIQIRGSHFLGYLTDHGFVAPGTTDDGFLPTGDSGAIDGDGFVRVTGRLKNVLITSFGRNVSPEWVESEILAHPIVAQAVVFGDGEPQLSAAIVVRGDGAGIEAHLAAVNARLPDYARIARCAVTRVPFAQQEGLVHAGGAPVREAVARKFADVPIGPATATEKESWAFTIAS